jgi:hypothetical protein
MKAADGRGDGRREKALREALHAVEHAQVTLREAGMEDAAAEVGRTAERLRHEIAEHAAAPRSRHDGDAEFWRRNMDTLRIAMKGLAEAEKHDAADLMERAIHARELMIAGRRDPEAMELRKRGPDDAQLSELLRMAAGFWAEHGHEQKAAQCHELANHLAARGKAPPREGKDRTAHLEERLERMERTLREVLARLERERPPAPPAPPR